MTTAQGPVLQLPGSYVGRLDLGSVEVPYVDLQNVPHVLHKLDIDGAEYVYDRSFPVKGGSALMPDAVAELLAAGRKLIVGERGERYYLFLA